MSSTSIATRVAVVAVALAAAAWLGLSYRNAQLIQDARALAEQENPAPTAVERGLRDLDRSELLNPDHSEPQALRVVLEVRAKRFDRARAEVEELLRREPENADGWLLLASLTSESDPARSAQARERFQELNPLDPARGDR